MKLKQLNSDCQLLVEDRIEHLRRLGVQRPEAELERYVGKLFAGQQHTFFSGACNGIRGVAELHALGWDSEMFGLQVASIGAFVLDRNGSDSERRKLADDLIRQVAAEARERSAEMLVCRVRLSDTCAAQALERAGFVVMDVQFPMTLKATATETPSARAPAAQGTVLRDATADDEPKISVFAKSAFGRSHLYADERLPKAASDRLHEQWVRNDLAGRAVLNLVAEYEDELCGFVSALENAEEKKLLGFRHAHIDLLAVSEAARGKGLGWALTVELLDRLAAQDCQCVTVSTQAANLPAIHLYLRAGFLPSGVEITFHGWMDEILRR